MFINRKLLLIVELYNQQQNFCCQKLNYTYYLDLKTSTNRRFAFADMLTSPFSLVSKCNTCKILSVNVGCLFCTNTHFGRDEVERDGGNPREGQEGIGRVVHRHWPHSAHMVKLLNMTISPTTSSFYSKKIYLFNLCYRRQGGYVFTHVRVHV